MGPDTACRYEGSGGLPVVNPISNYVNQHSEVANQYAEIGLEGQESARGGTGRNGECETSSHNKV